MTVSANYLAIDLGASSGRVMLGRGGGNQGFELEELHRFPNLPINVEGHLHWDVEKLWSEIKRGLAEYATRYPEPLTSIGVDSWAVDYALLDEKGELLDLPFHYRDHRTDGLMEQVLARLGRARIFKQTGLQFLPFNTLFQLYSQVRASDPRLKKAATLLMMPDLFHYRLSGKPVSEYTNATTTQFFAVKEKRWATEMLEELGIPTNFLPPVVAPGTVLGEVLPELAREFGLHRQPQAVRVVAPGSHDTASAVAGIPYLDPQSAYISSGTWSLLGAEVTMPVLRQAALAWNFTNEGGVAGTIRLLKNVMGLWLVQECQRIWQQAGQVYSWERLAELSGQAPAFTSLIDPDASDFLSPENMPDAIRAYCQRSGQPVPDNPGKIIRCCLESLALKYRVVLNQLEQLLGHRITTIRIVGGGCQNEVLCQFTADACKREVVAGPVEATALGNIVVQAIAVGHLSGLTAGRAALESSVTLKRYSPADTDKWVRLYARFERLVAASASG